MGRAVKRRGPSPDAVVRLFDEAWQRWEFPDGAARQLPPETELAPGAFRRVIAVPARQVICSPLWIDGTDAALAPETAKLELEVRGLLPRVQGMEGISMRLHPQESRTLAIVAVFPPELPEGAPAGDAFAASPYLLDLPRDAATLWRESDDIVVAFTRGDHVVYWETIDRAMGAEEIRGWLSLLCLRLRGEVVIDAVPRVVSWVEGLPASRIAPVGCEASDELGDAAAGVPSFRNAQLDWKPVSVRAAEAQRARRERIKRVVLAVAACYIVIAAGFTIYSGILKWKISGLTAQVAKLNAEVAKFQPISQDWSVIAPTALPSVYPLEILSGVVSGMPPKDVNLTRFQVENGTLTVEGEAQTFQLATDFFNALATAEAFKNFNMQADTPQMKPNNTASFRIHGTIPQDQP